MTVKEIKIIYDFSSHSHIDSYKFMQHTFIMELINPKYDAKFSNLPDGSWYNKLTLFEHSGDYFICKGKDKQGYDIFTGISAIYTADFIFRYLKEHQILQKQANQVSSHQAGENLEEFIQYVKSHIRIKTLDKLLEGDNNTIQFC